MPTGDRAGHAFSQQTAYEHLAIAGTLDRQTHHPGQAGDRPRVLTGWQDEVYGLDENAGRRGEYPLDNP